MVDKDTLVGALNAAHDCHLLAIDNKVCITHTHTHTHIHTHTIFITNIIHYKHQHIKGG